jgi:hypothetical protein
VQVVAGRPLTVIVPRAPGREGTAAAGGAVDEGKVGSQEGEPGAYESRYLQRRRAPRPRPWGARRPRAARRHSGVALPQLPWPRQPARRDAGGDRCQHCQPGDPASPERVPSLVLQDRDPGAERPVSQDRAEVSGQLERRFTVVVNDAQQNARRSGAGAGTAEHLPWRARSAADGPLLAHRRPDRGCCGRRVGRTARVALRTRPGRTGGRNFLARRGRTATRPRCHRVLPGAATPVGGVPLFVRIGTRRPDSATGAARGW